MAHVPGDSVSTCRARLGPTGEFYILRNEEAAYRAPQKSPGHCQSLNRTRGPPRSWEHLAWGAGVMTSVMLLPRVQPGSKHWGT